MIHTHLIGQPAAASGFSVKRYSLALAIAALAFGWGAPTMAAFRQGRGHIHHTALTVP